MKKLTVKEAEKLMRKYLKNKPHKIYHSIKVSKFAYQIAKKIKEKNPKLNINLKEVRVLGLLHDIGLSVSKKWRYHVFEGGKLLRKLGYSSYASKIEKHDPTHELARHFKIKGDFLPNLIEEKILVYADLHYKRNKFVGPEERFRIGMKDVKRKTPELLPLFIKYDKRRAKLIKEIEKLMK
jgi:putative nucleotidyltransferase with HDIG domain